MNLLEETNCAMTAIVPTQVDGGAAKEGTAQSFRLANLARIFINLSKYNDCNNFILFQSRSLHDDMPDSPHNLSTGSLKRSASLDGDDQSMIRRYV